MVRSPLDPRALAIVAFIGAIAFATVAVSYAVRGRLPTPADPDWNEPEDGFEGILSDSYTTDLALSLRNRPVIG